MMANNMLMANSIEAYSATAKLGRHQSIKKHRSNQCVVFAQNMPRLGLIHTSCV